MMIGEEQQRQYMISIINSIITEAETQRNTLTAYYNTIAQAIKSSEQQSVLPIISTAISELNAAINSYYNILGILRNHVFE